MGLKGDTDLPQTEPVLYRLASCGHLQVGLRWQRDLGLQQDTDDKALRKAENSVLSRFDLSCWRWKMFREDEPLPQKGKVCLMCAGTPDVCLSPDLAAGITDTTTLCDLSTRSHVDTCKWAPQGGHPHHAT